MDDKYYTNTKKKYKKEKKVLFWLSIQYENRHVERFASRFGIVHPN
jgi:hypothetical protein